MNGWMDGWMDGSVKNLSHSRGIHIHFNTPIVMFIPRAVQYSRQSNLDLVGCRLELIDFFNRITIIMFM